VEVNLPKEPARGQDKSAPNWEAEFAEAWARVRRRKPGNAEKPPEPTPLVYYTEENFAEIRQSFVVNDRVFDEEKFRITLEKLTWFYITAKTEIDPLLKLSERKRHLEAHLGKLRRSRKAWVAINGNHYLAYQTQMAAIAKQVPDKSPGSISYIGRPFPVSRRLLNIRRALESACEIIEKAIDQVQDEIEANGGKGSNRPDVPLYEFTCGIWKIYSDMAAKPKMPHGWTESATEGENEFLSFLAACLKPLGEKKSPNSLFKLFRKARA
jgi:hypothetical protein